jgi:hypothetical protein
VEKAEEDVDGGRKGQLMEYCFKGAEREMEKERYLFYPIQRT